MRHNTLRRHSLTAASLEPAGKAVQWRWKCYLHDGEITLLTSQWKTGKTTLIAGLLGQLATGGEFLGQPLRLGKAWVISEESTAW